MTDADVKRAVIEVLATMRRRDRDEFAAEIDAGGKCDSVWLVKAGVRVARLLGFKLKPGKHDAKHFKSVDTLAVYLNKRRNEENA